MKVTSNIYKTSLQRQSVTSSCHFLPTNLLPGHLFALKWRPKSSGDEIVLKRQRKVLPRFVVESWSGKLAHFSLRHRPPTQTVFYWFQLTWPNNFLMATWTGCWLLHNIVSLAVKNWRKFNDFKGYLRYKIIFGIK